MKKGKKTGIDEISYEVLKSPWLFDVLGYMNCLSLVLTVALFPHSGTGLLLSQFLNLQKVIPGFHSAIGV